MPTDKQLDQKISRWLEAEAPGQVPDRVLRATFERTRKTRQHGGWRALLRRIYVNKIVPIGLAAAAVVLVLGAQLLGPPAPSGVGGAPSAPPSPTAAPTSDATPSPTAWAGIDAGPFVLTSPADPVQVTLDIASPGWSELQGLNALSKNDDGLDSPVSVGTALLAWTWPAGTGFNVYQDPCKWSTTIPETPATTPDEIAAAFVTQAETDATAPVDVTVGGYAGKAVTLHVPMAYDAPNATREEKFADCDNDEFAFYGIDGESDFVRNAQGAGQVDELWILDVDGAIVILDATYSPAVPAELIDDLRTLAKSATFE
ncbi:MAG: hypothetical protein ABIP77_05165 [Candidatus Limnocylindrales bacterium]